MKWKDRLLSSSVPLEFEVGKILAKNKFAVDFDYSYKRLDGNLEKEFSIDIKASAYYPFPMKSSIKMEIDMLIECKYRNPNVSWLFVKDINIREYSNFSLRGVMKLFDEFSEYTCTEYTSIFPYCELCLKGIEVNSQNGEVHDKGINHGVNQLSYSLPTVLENQIYNAFIDDIEDNKPFIIIPILVTTADLRILNSNFSIEKLNDANNLDDISKPVNYLRFYNDVYPSLQEHCRNTFKDILEIDKNNRLEYYKELRKNDFNSFQKGKIKKFNSDPNMLINELIHGYGKDSFREILICNFDYFPNLVKELKEGLSLIGRNLKKIKKQPIT